MISVFLFAALAVLPADRLTMADRLFNRGEYAAARVEYDSLVGEASIPEDSLLYRRAECARAEGRNDDARARYDELLSRHPVSEFAQNAMLERALIGPEAEKASALRRLDDDSIKASVRVAALYHLGVIESDADALARCVALDPNGSYAVLARFRRATILQKSPDAALRREGLGELLEIAFGKNPRFAEQALYLAAVNSYEEKRYGEAASLFRRYLKTYLKSSRVTEATVMCAWSLYLEGRFADSAAFCGTGGSDDLDYLRGACAYASDDRDLAGTLLQGYLDSYPKGRYRDSAQLTLTRIDLRRSMEADDRAHIVESARRTAALSKKAADRLRLAWAYEHAGREDEAMAEYHAIAKDFSGTAEAADALFRKALVDIRAKRWAPAELALAEVLKGGKLQTGAAEALYWRGVCASALGHDAEASGFLAEADRMGLSLDQSREARLLIADNDWKEGRVAQAKESYAKLVREGASERMPVSKMIAVGRFLLDERDGGRRIEEARQCARAAIAAKPSAEWRQAAYALEGAASEAASEYSAAIEAYRKAMAEKCRTEVTGPVSARLGALEVRSGENAAALKTLEEAVRLNVKDAAVRRDAYLGLARASLALGDREKARGYAMVVTTLFGDSPASEEAERILATEEGERK